MLQTIETEELVAVTGRLDLKSSRQLLHTMARRANAALDLSRIDYIDMSGLAALMQLRKAHIFQELSEPIERALRLLGTNTLSPCC